MPLTPSPTEEEGVPAEDAGRETAPLITERATATKTDDVRLDVANDAAALETGALVHGFHTGSPEAVRHQKQDAARRQAETELAHGFALEGSPVPSLRVAVFARAGEWDGVPVYMSTVPGSDVAMYCCRERDLWILFSTYSVLTEEQKKKGLGEVTRKSDGGRVPIGAGSQTWRCYIDGTFHDRPLTVRGLASAEEWAAAEQLVVVQQAARYAKQDAERGKMAARNRKKNREKLCQNVAFVVCVGVVPVLTTTLAVIFWATWGKRLAAAAAACAGLSICVMSWIFLYFCATCLLRDPCGGRSFNET